MTLFDFTIPGVIINLTSSYDPGFGFAWFIIFLVQFVPFYLLATMFLWAWSIRDLRDTKKAWLDQSFINTVYGWGSENNLSESSDDDVPAFLVAVFFIWSAIQVAFIILSFISFLVFKLPLAMSIAVYMLLGMGLLMPVLIWTARFKIRNNQKFLSKLGQEEAP